MLDDLRRQADEENYEELGSQEFDNRFGLDQDERFLGLTPFQRFFIALMLLVITVLVGTLWLLVNGKIVPPFM